MTSPHLCPTCGRRASERLGIYDDVAVDCQDPLHDLADAAPEMREALAVAVQLARVCSDWNLAHVEVSVPEPFIKRGDRDGRLVSIGAVVRYFGSFLSQKASAP